MSEAGQQDVQSILREAAVCAPAPAVALAVVDPWRPLGRVLHGVANLETGEAVTADHWWDLASLTKVLVTLPAILDLVAQGRLQLSDALAGVWPKACGSSYAGATIGQLLSYDAGAPPAYDLFRLGVSTRHELVEAALSIPAEREPGSGGLYSDVGMLLLGELVTHITGASAADAARARGWCRYPPLPGPAVATEQCAWRERLIVGEVHDENAAALGGVAGHAGAFGKIASVAEAARAWLTGDACDPALWAQATSCWSTGPDGERFGLGFRLSGPHCLGGRQAGSRGFGASGFVGNRLWVEPDRGYAVVILSNRIHPQRGPRDSHDAWCDDLLDELGQTMTPSPACSC